MSNSIPQPIIWAVQHDNGKQTREFDKDGKETVMTKEYIAENKNKFAYIALIDCLNNITYSINLKNGKLVLGGQEFAISKEHKVQKYIISDLDIDYQQGVIQYKSAKPILVTPKMLSKPIQTECESYNIGYKIDLPENFLVYPHKKGTMSIVKAQVGISINADTLQPNISVGFLAKFTKEDGKEEMIRI